MILTTEEVITTILKVFSAMTKVILTTEEEITATLKLFQKSSISRLTGKCAAQKLKTTFAVLVYGHVYIIWSYQEAKRKFPFFMILA